MCNNNKKISEIIRERLKNDNKSFHCNENISDFIKEQELDMLVDEVTANMETVLQSLVIDTENDHNTHDTARRVAKMFVNEIFSGRFVSKPKITAFPNHLAYDQLYVTGPITVRSTCAHHFQSIKGNCYIGVFPGTQVIGLSKFNRLVDWVASRPQIQEEMTMQIADHIEKATQAEGIAVIVTAEHACMTMRGVKEPCSNMVTSIMRGKFREDANLKAELLSLIGQMK